MTALPPTAEQVTAAWIAGITGIDTTAVDDVLPRDNSTWAASGFVQVRALPGGPGPGGYIPLRQPVLQVDCWAVNPTSGYPPWGHAANLAELIVAATQDQANYQRPVTVPGYATARVLDAQALTEPRRVPSDAGSYAHYRLDLAVRWVSAG